MRVQTEDRWHCTDPACGCELLIERGASQDGKNPRCSCGEAMKKKYAPPVLTYLDFLCREEKPKIATREE